MFIFFSSAIPSMLRCRDSDSTALYFAQYSDQNIRTHAVSSRIQGLMGHGIAQIAAQGGFQVLAIEAQEEALSNGMKR
jgi:3-hydroxyacyl-CoA dehydrogenase, NAD binding domain